MRVGHVSYWDITGGAARAAYRIHHSLRERGLDSHMYVSNAASGDCTVQVFGSKRLTCISDSRRLLARLLTKSLRTQNRVPHSPAVLPSFWPRRLKDAALDLIHLHWVAAEMMSIADIGRLSGPVVWTLHDMWAFCGAEHLSQDSRWREGYVRGNRPACESGFDLNRWTWQRKSKHWRRPIHVVAPSRWLGDCARQSELMRDWPVSVVPNPIDTEVWRPVDKSSARSLLRLPAEAPLLLFGAMGGTRDPNKGFDLLRSSLDHLRNEFAGLELVVFGQLAPREPLDLGFPIHYAGHLHDDVSLRLLYSAADAVIVPSRQETLPNTAVEGHACGTPVVAFDVGGLPDIVEHQKTGYLARNFDTHDLARGIQWVLGGAERHATLSARSRQVALEKFSYPVVAEQYQRVYEAALRAQ